MKNGSTSINSQNNGYDLMADLYHFCTCGVSDSTSDVIKNEAYPVEAVVE